MPSHHQYQPDAKPKPRPRPKPYRFRLQPAEKAEGTLLLILVLAFVALVLLGCMESRRTYTYGHETAAGDKTTLTIDIANSDTSSGRIKTTLPDGVELEVENLTALDRAQETNGKAWDVVGTLIDRAGPVP